LKRKLICLGKRKGKDMVVNFDGIIKRYRNFLPVDENTPVVSLNEVFTPLIKSQYF